jgi:hypothetical protein
MPAKQGDWLHFCTGTSNDRKGVTVLLRYLPRVSEFSVSVEISCEKKPWSLCRKETCTLCICTHIYVHIYTYIYMYALCVRFLVDVLDYSMCTHPSVLLLRCANSRSTLHKRTVVSSELDASLHILLGHHLTSETSPVCPLRRSGGKRGLDTSQIYTCASLLPEPMKLYKAGILLVCKLWRGTGIFAHVVV